MRFATVAIFLLACGLMLNAQHMSRSPLDGSRQAIVVTTSEWTDIQGTLQRYERNAGGVWRPYGSPIPVVIGRSGLGWGNGLAKLPERSSDPIKKEGDGRSPAGIFSIGPAFGYASEKPGWTRLPYIPLSNATECVDDAGSAYYNSIVDRIASTQPTWNSSEKMRQIDAYLWGVVVEQNAQRERGAGSCIFLHIWGGPQHPTAGCTAMSQENVQDLLRWLNPDARPIMVALPKPEYQHLRAEWQLP